MLHADRVWETSTTTGTGNLTLAGASTNCITFNTGFGTGGRRFIYWIVDATNAVWETGIGYLSASTTLVRETVLRNSSGTTSALTLAAGTKDVFCDWSENSVTPGLGVIDSGWQHSAHFATGASASFAVTVDRVYYSPYLHLGAKPITALGVGVLTAAGTKLRLGIYESVAGRPAGAPITQTANITPTTGTNNSASITALNLPCGWYYAAFVCDGAASVRAPDVNYVGVSQMGCGNDQYGYPHKSFYESAASWSALPTVGTLTQSSSAPPKVMFGS